MTTEELKLLITGDSSGGQAAIKDFGEKLKEAVEHPLDSAKALSAELGTELAGALGTVGIAATAAVTVLAAVGVAAFELGEQAAAVGADIERLSHKIGDSTENISKLKYATDIAGGSVEGLTNVAYMMSVRLGDAGAAGDKARGAIARLGIDVNEFLDAAPSERILLLSDALRDTSASGDEVRRALMDLGGRGVRDQVDVLMKDLRGLTEQGEAAGAVWSEVDAKAAEDFEMKVRALHEQWSLFTTNIGRLFIPALLELAEGLNHIFVPGSQGPSTTGQFLDPEAQKLANAYSKALEKDRDTAWQTAAGMDGLSISIHANAAEVDQAITKHEQLAERIRDTGRQADDTRNIFGGQTTINASVETSYQDLAFKVPNFGSSQDLEAATATADARDYLQHHRDEIQAAADAMDNLTSHSLILTRAETETGAVIGGTVIPMFTTLTNATHGVTGATQALGEQLEGSLVKTLERVPQTLVNAFTGGGGLTGGLSAIGSMLGSGLGDTIGKSISMLGKFGGPIGSALGSLVGPLISGIANIGGPSKEELQGRQTEAQFEQQMGGWQGIQKALTDVGVSADQANSMIQKLWASEKQGAGATQQSIDAINKLIKDHASDVAKGVDGILAAAKNVGANFPAAMQPMVDKLLSLPGLTDAEKKSLNDLLKSAEPDFKQLTEMAGTYGLKLTDLGPKFEQADISGRADKIVSDFGALTKAGADVGGVLHGMGKSINDLVNDAQKYGSTLPTALKPLVEELAKTGQLTDESGKKFTDVSKLTFDDTKDPLAKGLSNLTDTIQHLIDLLSGNGPGSLTGAIDAVTSKTPKNPFADWGPPQMDFGDLPVQPMAKGGIGRVTRPTLFLAGEHGAEDFAFSGGGKRFGGGGMTMGDTHLTFNVHGATDPQIFAQTLHHVLRTDTGLINTAIQIIADKRIAAAA